MYNHFDYDTTIIIFCHCADKVDYDYHLIHYSILHVVWVTHLVRQRLNISILQQRHIQLSHREYFTVVALMSIYIKIQLFVSYCHFQEKKIHINTSCIFNIPDIVIVGQQVVNICQRLHGKGDKDLPMDCSCLLIHYAGLPSSL